MLVNDVERTRPRGRVGGYKANERLVEGEKESSVSCSLANQVLFVGGKGCGDEGIGRADLFTHKEHERPGGESSHAEHEAATSFRVGSGCANQRGAVHRGDNGALRAWVVAALVVAWGHRRRAKA